MLFAYQQGYKHPLWRTQLWPRSSGGLGNTPGPLTPNPEQLLVLHHQTGSNRPLPLPSAQGDMAVRTGDREPTTVMDSQPRWLLAMPSISRTQHATPVSSTMLGLRDDMQARLITRLGCANRCVVQCNTHDPSHHSVKFLARSAWRQWGVTCKSEGQPPPQPWRTL